MTLFGCNQYVELKWVVTGFKICRKSTREVLTAAGRSCVNSWKSVVQGKTHSSEASQWLDETMQRDLWIENTKVDRQEKILSCSVHSIQNCDGNGKREVT